MTERGLCGFLFFLLAFCFLLRPGLAQIPEQVPEQVPEPAQCLVSGIYSLTRLPESKGDQRCYHDCLVDTDCHMIVVTRPVSGPSQCLLVNCLNQGQHSYPRDPSAQISVYPKSTLNDEQRAALNKALRAVDDETGRCSDIMTYSSCRSGTPKFFYNRTSYRCEQFYTGCGSNRNTFDTQEACEALCSQKFRCYRPMEHGQRPPIRFTYDSDKYDDSIHNKIFYNVSSSKCEGFHFRGSASNGNIFDTVEECERLCAGVKAPATSQPAVDSDHTVTASTDNVPAKNTGVNTTGPPAADSDTTVAASADGTDPTTSPPAVNTDTTTSPPAVDSATTTNPPAVESDTTVAAPTEGRDVAAPVTSFTTEVLLGVFLAMLLAVVGITALCRRLFPRPSPDRYQRLPASDPAQ